MAIIYNYPLNSILLAEDMLIGTSTKIVNGQPKNATKNFSIADLTGFIKQNVSLNDVLLVGNTSLLDAKVGGLYLYDTPVAGYGNIVLNQNRFSFNTVTHGEVFRAQRDMFSSFSSAGYRGSFEVSSITANRVWDLPNKSGTVALLSDVPAGLTPTLQEVTDEGNITANSIIVEDNTILVKDNYNDTYFEINGYELIGKDLTTNESYFQLGYDGIMAAFDPPQVQYIQSLAFNTSGAQLQNYVLPSKPAGNYILATTSDTAPQVNSDWNSTSGVSEILNKPTIPAAQVNSDWNAMSGVAEILNKPTITNGTVTSIGLTMPSAFTVTNSPITSSGDIAVTGAGLVSQYVRGDGTLANFPASTGGGASVSYYLNGSVSQGTIGGVAYKEMNSVPVIGAGTDFTINADGYIQSFITDAGDPNKLLIPAGNWNFETYFSASSGGGSPRFYIELYKYDGTTFTLIASNSATPEYITGGTSIDLYFTALAVPSTVLLATDRLAVRFYVIHSGRTIKMHTEDSHLSQIITTFTTGLTALNGLTDQVQFFDVGTGATNFNISSSGDTHTFNLLFNIRRNANNSSNNNINYNGYAPNGSAEATAVWTIKRLTIAASGSITIATATNVAWTNRESATYI